MLLLLFFKGAAAAFCCGVLGMRRRQSGDSGTACACQISLVDPLPGQGMIDGRIAGIKGGKMTTDLCSVEEMKERGAGRVAPDGVASLYYQAFQQFGSQSLWGRQPGAQPTIAQALVVSDCLRREGDQTTRCLANLIEDACRAAFQTAK
ncbi:MAG: hypothetical protein H7838_03860 [Magnetococcus sp. DMHC-8]